MKPLVAMLVSALLWAADEDARILRPGHKTVINADTVDIIAKAPGGRLELDGKAVAAEQPFPDVLHAKLKVSPGEHSLALIWADGRKEIRFFSGAGAPSSFQAFRTHPPSSVACTQCHEVSRRGRFIFKGGCFDCHQKETFAKAHTHTPDTLSECGLCHNAHGSAVKAHLLHTREVACKQCHN
jgi:predicted CXXCH cytochrome family protein